MAEELRRLRRLIYDSPVDWPQAPLASSDERGRGVLLDMAKSGDPEDRLSALEGLGADLGEGHLEVFLSALWDDDARVRASAERHLAVVDPERLLRALCDRVMTGDAEALDSLERSLPRLRRALEGKAAGILANEDEDTAIRCAAAYCLGSMGGDVASRALAGTARASSGQLAAACAEALTCKSVPTAMEDLVALSGHPDTEVRLYAIQGLARLGGPKAVGILDAMVMDTAAMDEGLRREAVYLLGLLGGEEAIPALIHAMNNYLYARNEAFLGLRRITGLSFNRSTIEWGRWYYKWKQEREPQPPQEVQPLVLNPPSGKKPGEQKEGDS